MVSNARDVERSDADDVARKSPFPSAHDHFAASIISPIMVPDPSLMVLLTRPTVNGRFEAYE